TPLVAYGDRSTLQDVDYFSVESVALYRGPMTFRVQTAGISPLAPRLSVFDQNFRLLGQAQSSSALGDVVTVRLPQVGPLARRFYTKVDSAAQDFTGIGRYAVSVTFDDRLLVDPGTLPALLRGPYDLLTNPNDFQQLFLNPRGVFFNDDLGTNFSF